MLHLALLCLAHAQADIMPPIGGTLDASSCVIGAGYSWCEASQSCIRPWVTPCADHYADCADCLARQKRGENIACPSHCDKPGGIVAPLRPVDPPPPLGLPRVPRGCSTWFDGCNTCQVVRGADFACTEMMCFTLSEPYCQTYEAGALAVGEVCYRFCEDGSQPPIFATGSCAAGAHCVGGALASFDTCGEHAMRCAAGH